MLEDSTIYVLADTSSNGDSVTDDTKRADDRKNTEANFFDS